MKQKIIYTNEDVTKMMVCFVVDELKFGLNYLKVLQYHAVGSVELVVQLAVLMVVVLWMLTIALFGSSGNGSAGVPGGTGCNARNCVIAGL